MDFTREETTDKSVIVNLENNIDNIGNVFGIVVTIFMK